MIADGVAHMDQMEDVEIATQWSRHDFDDYEEDIATAVVEEALDRYRQMAADHSAVGSEIVRDVNHDYLGLACNIARALAGIGCSAMDSLHCSRTETGFAEQEAAVLFGTLRLLRVPHNPVAP